MAANAKRLSYREVADKLREQIEHGDISTGSALPSASELMEEFGVSSTVIKNAMILLRSSGHIEGQQGKAVFAKLPMGPDWLDELIKAGATLAAVVASSDQPESVEALELWDQALKRVPEVQLRRP
jgi:DNA-binding FadR family transcriptional regulator